MSRLQVGVDPGNYGVCPFLNWVHTVSGDAGPFLTISGVDKQRVDIAATRMDANSELTDTTGASRFYFYFYLQPVSDSGHLPTFSSRAMVVKWSGGSAVTALTGLSVTNLSVNLAGKRATFNMQSGTQGNAALFWALDGTNGGPTAIKIVPADQETLLDGGAHANPEWLAQFGRWHSVRFMDPMGTNGSEAVNFTDLATTSDVYWGGTSAANKAVVGWPPEMIIALLNAYPNVIAWVNIGHQLVDAAVTSWLTAIRDGVTDWSQVRLKIEYSNETWNSQFAQYTWLGTQAAGAGWTSGNSNKFSGYRAAQVMEIARTVFGTDSGTKWQGVLAPQLVSTAGTDDMKTGVDRHISNDAGAASTITKLFSRLATAGYTGVAAYSTLSAAQQAITYSGDYGVADPTETGLMFYQWAQQGQAYFDGKMYDALKAGGTDYNSAWFNNDRTRTYELAQKAKAVAFGLAYDQYEAGNHLVTINPLRDDGREEPGRAAVLAALSNFADSWQCAKLFADRCEQFISDTGGVPSRFVLYGAHNKYGYWAAYEYYGQYTSESGNACEAVNLGLTYRAGYRNVRTV